MPDHNNRGNADFSRFDAMSDEALEELLRLDAKREAGMELNTEEILYILEVLERRSGSDSSEKSAEEAFQSFKENYCPIDGNQESDHGIVIRNSETKKRKAHKWFQRVLATAAVFAVIVSVSVQVAGFDFWNTIANWTKEIFQFETGETVIESVPEHWGTLTSLEEAVNALNIPVTIIPTWFPDGYILEEVRISELPDNKAVLARYLNGDNEIKIQITDYLTSNPHQLEKSDSLVETYEVDNTSYYIFSNYEQTQVTWITDRYECNLTGNLTVPELKIMIESIQRG